MFVKEPGVPKPVRSHQPTQAVEYSNLVALNRVDPSIDADETVRVARPVRRLRVPDEFIPDL